VVAEARRRGGYNKAHTRRLRRLLEESGLAPVFEGALRLLARLEGGELSPQAAVAASHLLRVALETMEVAHKLAARGEGVPPQALPSITPEPQEERWARVMARAQQIYEELAASEAPPQLSEKEEREAQLIAKAAQIVEETMPPGLKRWYAASASPSSAPEAQEEPHVPVVGARVVMHGRSPYGEAAM
jgi:hypothetical protein